MYDWCFKGCGVWRLDGGFFRRTIVFLLFKVFDCWILVFCKFEFWLFWVIGNFKFEVLEFLFSWGVGVIEVLDEVGGFSVFIWWSGVFLVFNYVCWFNRLFWCKWFIGFWFLIEINEFWLKDGFVICVEGVFRELFRIFIRGDLFCEIFWGSDIL